MLTATSQNGRTASLQARSRISFVGEVVMKHEVTPLLRAWHRYHSNSRGQP